MRFSERTLLILILLTMSLPAQASRWYPIETGLVWVYTGGTGGSLTAIIQDPEPFAGTIVQPLQWDSDVRSYYSRDETGSVVQYELDAYGEGGVQTEVSSWGTVKALFRN